MVTLSIELETHKYRLQDHAISPISVEGVDRADALSELGRGSCVAALASINAEGFDPADAADVVGMLVSWRRSLRKV